jgi:ABC-2 type transport system permease protein
MLWYKAWLETRWRFLIGLALLALSAGVTVLMHPEVVKLLPLAPQVDPGSELGRRLAESAELASTYRGYIWSQWFAQDLPRNWTIFAVLLGSGGLVAQSAGRGALFTLSLPVSRSRLLGVRATTALGELFVLAVVPCVLLPVLSPSVGQSYGVGDALIHGVLVFAAGSIFFCLAFLLSTIFTDVWTPLLLALCAAFVLSLGAQVFHAVAPYAPYGVMTGEGYFRGQGLPWAGLVISAALSAAMLYGASINLARRDF